LSDNELSLALKKFFATVVIGEKMKLYLLKKKKRLKIKLEDGLSFAYVTKSY